MTTLKEVTPEDALNIENHSRHLFSHMYNMATASPEENSKSSAQRFRRFIRQLQDEYDLVAIGPEVNPRLELVAIVRNVYETEDKAPLSNNVKGRQETASLASWAHRLERARFPTRDSFGLPSTTVMSSSQSPSNAPSSRSTPSRTETTQFFPSAERAEHPRRMRLYGDSCKRLNFLQSAKTQAFPSRWSGTHLSLTVSSWSYRSTEMNSEL